MGEQSATFTPDVHTGNCCAIHGCKYGDNDCTVERGAPQESPCQVCTEYIDEEIESTKDTIETLKFLAQHPGWYVSAEAVKALAELREALHA